MLFKFHTKLAEYVVSVIHLEIVDAYTFFFKEGIVAIKTETIVIASVVGGTVFAAGVMILAILVYQKMNKVIISANYPPLCRWYLVAV